MRKASIDIGSNSMLLLIADIHNGQLAPITERFLAPRLGAGMSITGKLSDEHMDIAEADLRTLLDVCREYEVEEIKAGATAAVREASNGDAFVKRIQKNLGLHIEVLSGVQEAELTYRGAVSGRRVSNPAAVLDVGGGSTEITLGEGRCAAEAVSIPIGAVKLTDRFGKGCSANKDALKELDELLSGPAEAARGRRLIGVGGTMSTLASVRLELPKYDAEAIASTVFKLEEIMEMIESFRSKSIEQIRDMPGMEAKRADIIEAGATIIRTFMQKAGVDTIEVSHRGLRHGLILQ